MPESLRKLELQVQVMRKINALIQDIETFGIDDLEEISHRLDIVSQGYVEAG